MDRQTIRIYDSEKLLSFTYEDLLNFHGKEMPGGVALVFKLMCWIFADVAKEIPVRGSCSFYSGLGKNGKGIIDGADCVMQVSKNQKLFLNPDYSLSKNAPDAPGGGKYYFELGFNGKIFSVSVKQEVIPKEFFNFSKHIHQKRQNAEPITQEEKEKLQFLRHSLAETILNTKAENLFTAERIK